MLTIRRKWQSACIYIGMQGKPIDRDVPMVIFLTAVILAGLVTSGRDQVAAEKVHTWVTQEVHSLVQTSK